MLSSLFGDLHPRRLGSADAAVAESLFPETLVMEGEEFDGERTARSIEVLVDASPAQSIRDHFASTRSDLDQAGPMITLLDPTRLWAPQVMASLIEDADNASERLALRDHATLRTLATILRATIKRPSGEKIKVYHADIRTNGPDDDEVAHVLAERSHMCVVIVGGLQPHAIAGMIKRLVAATKEPGWRCPSLVFILPPGAAQLRHRLLGQGWPENVRTTAINESMMGGPAQLWAAILQAWTHREGAVVAAPMLDSVVSEGRHSPASRALGQLAAIEGILACAVIDTTNAEIQAFESIDMKAADMQAMARCLLAARNAHVRCADLSGPKVDEILVSAGPVTQLFRACSRGDQAIVALLDRSRVSLPHLRFTLIEAEKSLG